MEKNYLVSLNVSFTTPLGVEAKNKKEALEKARVELVNHLKSLDDYVDLDIEEDYVELRRRRLKKNGKIKNKR